MNDEAREKYYSIIDKKLVELFICCRNKEEYHFFNFSSALIKLEDEIRYNEVPEQAKRRFYDYVYYLNDIFNTTYSTLAISNIIYDDNAQIKRINFRQTCNNGEIIENTTEYLYSEILNIEDDKKLSHAMMQEQRQQSYSWFSTYTMGMDIKVINFEDVKLMRRLENMKLSYCPDGYRPPKDFAQFRGDLLAASSIETSTNSIIDRNSSNISTQELFNKFTNKDSSDKSTNTLIENTNPIKKNKIDTLVDLTKKWILVSDKEEFIERNKIHFINTKGKSVYIRVVAMQNNNQLKKQVYGEVAELFLFLQGKFNVQGTLKAFNNSVGLYEKNGDRYYKPEEIMETQKLLK